MNPTENESVVAELLRIADGALELEDPRERMEGLIARPGWSSWKVLREDKSHTRRARKNVDKKNNPKMLAKRKEWEEKVEKGECPPPKERKDDAEEEGEEFVPSPYDTLPYVPPTTWDEATLSERTNSLGFVEYASYDDVEPEWRRRVRESCFPPTEEEAKRFQLHKSLRCLPHDMDTGGFFVALLKKVKPLSNAATERMQRMQKESKGLFEVDAVGEKKSTDAASNAGAAADETEEDATMTESSAAEQTETTHNKEGAKLVSEEPIKKAPNKRMKADLGNENFIPPDPSLWAPIVDQFGFGDSFPKDQFFVRASGEAKVLYFISKSIKEDLIDRGIQDRVTVINSGLKAFERCSIQEAGARYRIAQEAAQFVVPHMTKRFLVAKDDDFYACIADGFIHFDNFSESFRSEVEALEPGSFIVALKGYEKDLAKKMFLVMWRRPNKVVQCFVAKVEMEGLFSKLRSLGYVQKEKPVVAESEVVEEESK